MDTFYIVRNTKNLNMKGKEGAIGRSEGVGRGKRGEASTRALRSANVRNRSNEARRRVRPIQPSSMRPQLTRVRHATNEVRATKWLLPCLRASLDDFMSDQ